ncbi:serine hydrolase domain-containing protein [Plantibacter sp. MPB07]|uniref:serine hydrolase domain-containing protein n=1 Tax=Plantibacter sp. MPB07 TaxID=3388853 RepID=UPI003986BC60
MIRNVASALHDAALSSNFSGVIRLDHPDEQPWTHAYGFADRAREQEMTVDHRCVLASVSKGFTALAIGSLIDRGLLTLETLVRPILDQDLPLVDDSVTIGHLLAHTSGIGDYIDEAEGEVSDYVFDRPVHLFDNTTSFLPVLDGRPHLSAPGEQFRYCNSGFVVLALIAERVSGKSYHDLVQETVFASAGMDSSGFPRTDEIDGDTALGYIEESGYRTNVLHLPLRGSGDGGAVSTVADLAAFWSALFDGRIVSQSTLRALIEPLHPVEAEHMRYGRGFWRAWTSELVMLEGYDAGVSARTWYDPESGASGSIIANTSEGAWPLVGAIDWPQRDSQ